MFPKRSWLIKSNSIFAKISIVRVKSTNDHFLDLFVLNRPRDLCPTEIFGLISENSNNSLSFMYIDGRDSICKTLLIEFNTLEPNGFRYTFWACIHLKSFKALIKLRRSGKILRSENSPEYLLLFFDFRTFQLIFHTIASYNITWPIDGKQIMVENYE